jgi:hypothetical protein
MLQRKQPVYGVDDKMAARSGVSIAGLAAAAVSVPGHETTVDD